MKQLSFRPKHHLGFIGQFEILGIPRITHFSSYLKPVMEQRSTPHPLPIPAKPHTQAVFYRESQPFCSGRSAPDAASLLSTTSHHLRSFIWGPGDFPWGRPNREICTLAEKQHTHWGRPFQSALSGWSVPTKKCGTCKFTSLPLSENNPGLRSRCCRPHPWIRHPYNTTPPHHAPALHHVP